MSLHASLNSLENLQQLTSLNWSLNQPQPDNSAAVKSALGVTAVFSYSC